MCNKNMKSNMTRREFLKVSAAAAPWFLFQMSKARHIASNAAQSGRPNFMVLVFDTLSAKHLPFHGYPRETAPNLHRFAQKATLFHEHYAAGNFTSAGTASLLTGTYPWSHRALHLHSTVLESFEPRNVFQLLPEEYHTVAYTHNLLVASLLHQFQGGLDHWKPTRELCLSDLQYSDLMFPRDYNHSFWSEQHMISPGETPGSLFISALYRVLRFGVRYRVSQPFRDVFPLGVPSLHSLNFILEDAMDWLQSQLREMPRPFFSYVHVLPPHEPYLTRHEFIDVFRDGWQPTAKPEHFDAEGFAQEELNNQRRLYDEYLAYADAEFGRLLSFMEKHDILSDTYVIVTSDHGEMFERGVRGHVTTALYEPIVRVPLMISAPGQTTRQDVHIPTSNVDLLPTILQLTGQTIPEWSEGSVLPTLGGNRNGTRPIFVVEAKSNPRWGPLTIATIAVRQGEHKLIEYRGYGEPSKEIELFNVVDDPEELEDVAASQPAIVAELLAAIDGAMPALGGG